MIKCEVTEYFTLKKFNELENIVRANENNNTKDGELFVGDTFDCTEEMAKYLTGDNDDKIVVVKILNGEETNDDLKDTDENKEGNNEEEGQTSNEENTDSTEEQEKENTDEENEEESQDAKNEENDSKEEVKEPKVIIDEEKVKEIVVDKKHKKRN